MRNEVNRTLASNQGAHVDLASLVDLELHQQLEIKFMSFMLDDKPAEFLTFADRKAWTKWKHDLFFERALLVWPDPVNTPGGLTVEMQIQKEELNFSNVMSWRSVTRWFAACSKIYKLHGSPDANAPEIVKQMIKKIELSGSVGLTVAIQLRQGGIPKQIEELWLKWEALRQHIDKIAREAAQYTGAGLFVGSANGLTRNERRQQERDSFKSLKKDKSGNGQNANPRNTGQPTKQQPTVTEMCRGCGRRHKTSDCKLIEGKHPDANTSSEAWASSVKGKAWKTAGFDFCQFERRIDGSAHAFALNKPKGSGGAASGGKFDKRGSTKSESDLLLYKRYDTLFIASTRSDITHTVPMKLRVPDTSFPLNVDCLIDTGALQSNYISNRTAAWLKATWDKEREVGVLDDKFVCVACNNCKHSTTSNLNSTSTNKPKMVNNKRKRAPAATGDKQPPSLPSRNRVTTVCFGISGMCTESAGEMVFDITFFNEVTGWQ